MIDVLVSVAAFIVAISVLVAVHEYGHYLVGRLCGMKVLRYSIGFGKPLWLKVAGKDQTEYCISAIPLGGYVKFLDAREGPVAPEDEGRAFNQRPVWARIATLLAGPGFNFLFAIVAYWALFLNGVPTVIPAVGPVEQGSYAASAGLETGDRILAVDEREAADWEAVLVAMLDGLVSDGTVVLRVADDAGNEELKTLAVGTDRARLSEPGRLFDSLGFSPWQPPAEAAEITPGGAADAAGLRVGDTVTRIDGEEIRHFGDLRRVVEVRPGATVPVEFLRDGERRELQVTLGSREVGGEVQGHLGFGIGSGAGDYWYLRQYGVVTAAGEAAAQTWASTAFTVHMLGRMVVGDVSVKNISGPINIAQYAGDSAAAGLNSFLRFLALVSISLGVLNLLPIPVLDGGQIVFQTVELLKGSPLSERSQLLGQQAGILALLLLMSFAFYNDIARLVQ